MCSSDLGSLLFWFTEIFGLLLFSVYYYLVHSYFRFTIIFGSPIFWFTIIYDSILFSVHYYLVHIYYRFTIIFGSQKFWFTIIFGSTQFSFLFLFFSFSCIFSLILVPCHLIYFCLTIITVQLISST